MKIFIAIALAALGAARTLVVSSASAEALKDSHAPLLELLNKDLGQIVEFAPLGDKLDLAPHGQPLAENVLVMLRDHDVLSKTAVTKLLTLCDDSSVNLFVLSQTQKPSAAVRKLAKDFGLSFPDEGYEFVDFFYDQGSSPEDLTKVFAPMRFSEALKKTPSVSLLDPSSSSVCLVNNKAQIFFSGSRPSLVAGVQTSNNARFGLTTTTSGKFSKLNFDYALVLDSLSWVFKKRNVVEFRNFSYRRANGLSTDIMLKNKEQRNLPTSMYPYPEVAPNNKVFTIGEEVICELDALIDGKPYVGLTDLQLEFVRMDVWVREFMVEKIKNSGKYVLKFKVPDQHGVYKFRVRYARPGLTTASIEEQISVRPMRHDEFERFIPSAFPYYASVFATLGGFVSFVALFVSAGES